MQQSSIKVEILNQIYTINGEASPEYILQLAEYVNGKIKDVSIASSTSSPLQASILAALNIADEYFQTKKIRSRIEGVVEEKTAALISMLDEGLIGDIFTRIDA